MVGCANDGSSGLTRRRRAALGIPPVLLLALAYLLGYITRLSKVFPDAYLERFLSTTDGETDRTSQRPRRPPGATPPEYRESPEPQTPADSDRDTAAEEQAKEALLSLGYAAGYERPHEATGVVQHDRSISYAGYNLLLSGHAPGALLLDMEGRTVHSWAVTAADVWPAKASAKAQNRHASYWKRAHLFTNGDLIAMFERHGLVKLDRRSRILWQFAGEVHHDLDVGEDGRIFTLLRRAHKVRRLDARDPTLEDFLVILDPAGRPLQEISILEAIERSPYANLLGVRAWMGGVMFNKGDILHTNTVSVLDGRHASQLPAFKKGNLLLALRSLDLVAVLDPAKREIVWGLTGMWLRPHEPVLLANGRLLIFDNEGWRPNGTKASRVLELDPVSQQIQWSYGGPPTFHSAVCGQGQRLPNGNTLITISTEGRVIEVTPGGRVVWEYLNPHSTVVDGQQRVATVFEMFRVSSSKVAALLTATD
jgi:hypothetical protein